MKTHTFAAALIVFGAAFLGISPSEAARICKPVLNSGTAAAMPTRAMARATAATKWSARVTSSYGLSWSNWSNALGKDYNCWKRTTVIGTNAWRCRAAAKPCRFN